MEILKGKIIAGTGHRPDKLNFEYTYNGPVSRYIQNELKQFLKEWRPCKCITGMAQGFDTLLALTCLELQIPLDAAIPFPGQETRWPLKAQQLYQRILANPLVTKYVIHPGPYNPKLLLQRNEWMVDRCDGLVAAWDGTSGGTAHCLAYAQKMNKPVYKTIDPKNILDII